MLGKHDEQSCSLNIQKEEIRRETSELSGPRLLHRNSCLAVVQSAETAASTHLSVSHLEVREPPQGQVRVGNFIILGQPNNCKESNFSSLIKVL